MKLNDTEIIEKYIAGELSNEEKQIFEQRLQTDIAFAETFNLYQVINDEMQEDPDEENFRKHLQPFTEKHFIKKESANVIPIGPRRKKWWAYAAAAACLAILFIWQPWVHKKLSNEELYAQNAIPEELPSIVRGSNDDSLLMKAIAFYNNKNYTNALPLLDSIITKKPNEAQLQLATGICYLQTGAFDRAIEKFDSLSAGQSSFKYDAVFWKAMTLLKQNKKNECIEALKQISSDANNYNRVRDLLQALQ